MAKYKKVDTDLKFVDREKEVEKFWNEEDIFKKSMENRKEGETYTFYDGPPTANGKPHIGHVLTRVIKDMIPRYRTMKGYMVPRKAAGTIIEQKTKAGKKVKKNTVIKVVISSGPEKIMIQSVEGMDEDAAKKALIKQGFTSKNITVTRVDCCICLDVFSVKSINCSSGCTDDTSCNRLSITKCITDCNSRFSNLQRI